MISSKNTVWRARGALLLGFACCLVAAGCGSSKSSSSSSTPSSTAAAAATTATPAQPTAATTIKIVSFKYQPPSLKVKAGARIRIDNSDSAEHTVTADNGAFDSGTVKPNGKGSVTFTKPGTYSYHCAFHAFMHGKVTVS